MIPEVNMSLILHNTCTTLKYLLDAFHCPGPTQDAWDSLEMNQPHNSVGALIMLRSQLHSGNLCRAILQVNIQSQDVTNYEIKYCYLNQMLEPNQTFSKNSSLNLYTI